MAFVLTLCRKFRQRYQISPVLAILLLSCGIKFVLSHIGESINWANRPVALAPDSAGRHEVGRTTGRPLGTAAADRAPDKLFQARRTPPLYRLVLRKGLGVRRTTHSLWSSE